MKSLLSWYHPRLAVRLVYMLQQVNYRAPKFIAWLRRFPNLNKVMHRQTLDKTFRARMLVTMAYVVSSLAIAGGLVLIVLSTSLVPKIVGAILIILTPQIVAMSLIVAVVTAHVVTVAPKEAKLVRRSKQIFANHPAIKVGVAGSYGKTSFKEILGAVLGEKLKVAVTPGNMNTPVAHARFADKLDGSEEVLILEYGEEYPGDIRRFIDVTGPDYAVLLGLAPNHLDYYKTIDALAGDLLELRTIKSADEGRLMINGESSLLQTYLRDEDRVFTSEGSIDWQIAERKISVDGLQFVMTRKGRSGEGEVINVQSGLVGRHFIAPLAMAVALAVELGLSVQDIEAGVAKTRPFEHRMQPRSIGGATILDDTYNGNVEGIIAGLELLDELEAKRKIYVTPGLVDQGRETDSVHRKIAEKINDVKPDLVVLMDNSATRIIQDELSRLSYGGMVQLEADPLNFYQNIDKVVAAGDLMMMQNDWTDNYS